MAVDINAITNVDELFEHVQWWRLDLFWDTRRLAGQAAAAQAVDAVLASRRVVGAVQTAFEIPLGLRQALCVAVYQDKVLVHGPEGQLLAGPDPEALTAALNQHAGAWVLEAGDEPELLAGDEQALEAAIGASVTGQRDPLAPAAEEAVSFGLSDAVGWGMAIKGESATAVLHRDVVQLSAVERLEEVAAAMPQDAPGAALSLRNYGSWWGLTYYTRERMGEKFSKKEPVREPSLQVAVGLGAALYPEVDPWASVSADHTPAQRLALALGGSHFLLVPEDTQTLEGMSAVRAEQVIAALARCVPEASVRVAPGLARSAAWFPELGDAVEMLGFDPAWVRVLAGTSPAPEGGEPIKPLGAGGAFIAEMKAETAKESARMDERAAQATGLSKLVWARAWKPNTRYVVGIVELLLAAGFLFLRPVPQPWDWVNLIAAAVFTVDGAWQVWDTISQEEAKRKREKAQESNEPPSP